jgi:cell division protein FtsW
MPKKSRPDYILLGTVIAVVLVGLIALLSASSVESQEDFGHAYSYFLHQISFGVGVGLLAGLVAYLIPYSKWRILALPLLVFTIGLLFVVFIPPLSIESGGARRWIDVFGISVQPSELAKLSSIIYLSAWFDGKVGLLRQWGEGFVPFLVIMSIIGGLIILQPDVGTLGVIALTAALMYFVAGARISQMAAIVGLGFGLLVALIKIAPYRAERLVSFLDRFEDPFGISYQINQSLLAVGSGGIFGIGIGKSLQKYNFLPEPMKDSIFAIWAEEVGFVGSAILIILFLLFAFRGLRIAKRAPDRFGKLLATGITSWIIFQAFVNMASMVGLVPLTGIPLPLMSYGGSSMATTLMGIGILLNISKQS